MTKFQQSKVKSRGADCQKYNELSTYQHHVLTREFLVENILTQFQQLMCSGTHYTRIGEETRENQSYH